MGVMSQADLTQQLHILTRILKIQNMIRRTMNLLPNTGQRLKKAMTKVMVMYVGDEADLEERPSLRNDLKLPGSIRSKEMYDVTEWTKNVPDWE